MLGRFVLTECDLFVGAVCQEDAAVNWLNNCPGDATTEFVATLVCVWHAMLKRQHKIEMK